MSAVERFEDITASDARDLTDRIKVALEVSWELIKQAYQTRAWAALGYASWDEYTHEEFPTARLKLPREERQEVVASLREIGMSTRAIASATGLSKSSVNRELASGVPFGTADSEVVDAEIVTDEPTPIADFNEWVQRALTPKTDVPDVAQVVDNPPARITGTDGRSYPAISQGSSRKVRRDAAKKERWSVKGKKAYEFPLVYGRWVDELLVNVDQNRSYFEKHKNTFRECREQLADLHYNDLRRARDQLTDLLEELGGDR